MSREEVVEDPLPAEGENDLLAATIAVPVETQPEPDANESEVTFRQAAKNVGLFALPLVGRSLFLIAANTLVPFMVSKEKEKFLAVLSEIQAIEMVLSAFYVSSAYSVPPLVGAVVNLLKEREGAGKVIQDAKDALAEYQRLSQTDERERDDREVKIATEKLNEAKNAVSELEQVLNNWAQKSPERKANEQWSDDELTSFRDTLPSLEAEIPTLPAKVGMIFRQSMVFAAIMGTVVAGAGLAMPYYFKLAKQPEIVVDHTKGYFQYASFGYLLDTLYRMQLRFVIGQGIRKTALIGEAFDTTVQLGLTFLFLFHTSLGLAGVALAYSLAKITTLIGHNMYLMRSATQKNFQLFSMANGFIQKHLLKSIVRNGLPIGVDSFIDVISINVITALCGLSGTKGLAAMQPSGLLNTVFGFPMGAVYQAVNRFVGEFHQKKNSRNAVTYGNVGIMMLASLGFLALLAGLLLPQYITSILINKSNPKDHQDYLESIQFLRVQGILSFVTSVLFALQGGLSGLLDNVVPMATTFIGLLASVASAVAVKYALKADESWIYASQIVGYTLATAILGARWMYQSRKYHAPDDTATEAAPSSGCCLFRLFSGKKSNDPERAPLLGDDNRREAEADHAVMPA